MRALRIGFNLLPFQSGIGGTWQYVSRLLAALAAHSPEHQYTAFVTPLSDSIVPQSENFTRVQCVLDPTSRPRRVMYESTVFPRLVGRERLDCLHHLFGTLPMFSMRPNVVTMYDLLAFERPHEVASLKRRYLQIMQRRAIEQATVLAPISEATAEQMRRIFGVSSERIQVVPAVIGDHFSRASESRMEQFRATHALPKQFWLFVAASYPHKNHEMLLKSFADLRRRAPGGWPLVIRGELPGPAQDLVRTLALGDQVIVLPRLTDEEMGVLYSSAGALVFPSLFEGGGLPVMEAMACGCPVVASRMATTEEFAGDAAVMFDATSSDDLARVMRDCEASTEVRARLAAAGLRAATRLRPGAAAEACVEAYRRATHRR